MTQAQKEAYFGSVIQQAKQKNPQMKDFKLTQEMMDRLSASQMVDVVPLLIGNKGNDWMQVSMYVDDSGTYKQLEVNRRASALAGCCGKALNVLGDAFLSRARDDSNDIFDRLDFKLADLDSSASWVVAAKARNVAKAAAEEAAGGEKSPFPAAAAGAGADGGSSGGSSSGSQAAAAAGAPDMSKYPQATPGAKVWIVNLVKAKSFNAQAAVVLPLEKQRKAYKKGRIAIEIVSSKKQLTALPENLVTSNPMA